MNRLDLHSDANFISSMNSQRVYLYVDCSSRMERREHSPYFFHFFLFLDWCQEAVSKAEILRLIYQGRFLHSNVTLGALGLPYGKTTVMHLVPRENLPEPNSQGTSPHPYNLLPTLSSCSVHPAFSFPIYIFPSSPIPINQTPLSSLIFRLSFVHKSCLVLLQCSLSTPVQFFS